jgi:SAM-dependent methyltransferase
LKQLNEDIIRSFYENIKEIWPSNDIWHTYSRSQIDKYLKKHPFHEDAYILNAGSAGNDYGIKCKMHHIDIAKNKIEHLSNSTVASIENLPFANESFDGALCVGSVLNYCDAMVAISELERVTKHAGIIIFEFESSWGFEYKGKPEYKKLAEIVTVKYMKQLHTQWLYSYEYIKKIMKAYNLKLIDIYRFHILSALHYNKHNNENMATPFAEYDYIFRHIPYFKKHANNIIILCKKL